MEKSKSKNIKSEVLKKIRKGQRGGDVASARGIEEATVYAEREDLDDPKVCTLV